ncbi:hypothetical protein JOF41_005185 [Saccharothrix coeruleofusca]|uniref:DUF397 domain-containing protein n=1 Tax=Saccharothrix coeruleofusca TaxID=33919 RepID=UPI001AEB597E|nr:DUF397 domain-containing protein [Saccharothrix coeruleofusca]MBP2339007.1 hypothetical protein [Saccharothrix coeruleofusca]
MSTVDIRSLVWRKSSRSGSANNSNCVEVAWRKSSHSGGGTNGNCVEVAFSDLAVAVRDSKNPNAGLLSFPASSWQRFLRP